MEPARWTPESEQKAGLSDFRLGDRLVRPGLNRIEGPAGAVQLEPRVIEVLVHLAARRGGVVSKEELVREVWEGRYVSDDVVWRSIGELRRALGDDARRPGCIETVAKRGYRLVVPVEPVGEAALPPAALGRDETTSGVSPTSAAPEPLRPGSAAGSSEAAPSRVEAPSDTAFRGRRLVSVLVLLLAAVAVLGFALLARRGDDASPAGGERRVRLAVLPLENLSGDPSQDYFADGLTEELIARLGSLQPEALGVIGRGSVMSFKGSGRDPARIAQDLGVDYLLEGSVRREGERVRVTARLLQASDRTAVWTMRQDMSLWGTLHLQSRVAERVARELALELLPARRAALERAAAATPAAHDAYLRGRYLLNQGRPGSVRRSLDPFTRAVTLDPSSAAAWGGLADAHHLLAMSGGERPADGYSRAEAAARRALALDPGAADVRATLGSILFRFHRDFQAAEAEFRRALADHPGSATAHHDYAWFLVSLGRFDEGLAEIRAARVLDPLSPRASADVGWVLYRARRHGEAITEMRRVLELEPDWLGARHCLERALAHLGRLEEARAEARESLRLERAEPAEAEELTAGEPRAALRRVAAWRLERLLARARGGTGAAARPASPAPAPATTSRPWIAPSSLAALRLELGDVEGALADLARAEVERDPALVSLAVDPAFDPLRGDPRFLALLARLGLR